MHVNIDQQFLLLLPGSLINIYTFSIPPPSLRTRQACDARRQSGTGRVFRMWDAFGVWETIRLKVCELRDVSARVSKEKEAITYSPSLHPSSKGMLRLPSCRVHPLSCYWICSKTFQIRPANASNAPCVYVRVCTIFDAERRGRTCSGMFCHVRSKFFLGILLIFVLSPCAWGKWSRWIFGERIFPWQGKWKCRPNNRIFPLPFPLPSARNEHAFYFPFERCLSNNKRLWIDAQGGGEAWMDNAARVSGPDVSPCQR